MTHQIYNAFRGGLPQDLATLPSSPAGVKSYVSHPRPVTGGVPRLQRGLGALGFEVTLFKLAGLGGLGAPSPEEVASAERFREMQYRAGLQERERRRQQQEQERAIREAKEASERSYEQQKLLIEASEPQLETTVSGIRNATIVAVIGVLGYALLTRKKKRK